MKPKIEKVILKYLNGKIEPKVENTFYSDKISARKKRLPYFYYTAKHKLVTRDLILENTSKKDFLLNNYHVLLHPIIFIQTAENLGFAGGNNVGLNMILNSNNIDNNSNVLLLKLAILILWKCPNAYSRLVIAVLTH